MKQLKVEALTRSIEPDSQWRHTNGNLYRVVAVGVFAREPGCRYLYKYCRHGSFINVNSKNSDDRILSLWDYQGLFVYSYWEDLGEMVFYYGDSGRFARSKTDFLGLKSDDLRFTLI